MFAVKCIISDAEKIKTLLIGKNLINKDFLPKREGDEFFFPLNSEDTGNLSVSPAIIVEVSSDFFRQKEKPQDFKSLLRNDFTEDELSRIKTAYDIMGSIAIIEVDEEFESREKIIAQAVLTQNKPVKTVLAKSGIHEGTYRTQKMKYVAGVNTKETTYLENGVKIKLNVETVYFSSRLSEERKRIVQLVNPGESIIELFSGCAPYALVLSKNTLAKEISGIEINPDGHWYGLENIKLNKSKNIRLFCGDAKILIPRFNNLGIGHKGGLDNFDSIYFDGLQLYELQLKRDELDTRFDDILKLLDLLAEKGVSVMIHHIPHYHNADVALATDNISDLDKMVGKFMQLCKKRNVLGFGLHCTDIIDTSEFCSPEETGHFERNIIKNLNFLFDKYKKENILDLLYVENSIRAIKDFETFQHIKKKTGLKNVVLDMAHLFISQIHSKHFCNTERIDTEKLRNLISNYKKTFNVYFHIADTTGDFPETRDAHEIGSGIIPFDKVADLIDFGVIEVWDYMSKDYSENRNSFIEFCKIRDRILAKKTFDRILMPLPKSAEDFLDDALYLAHDGSIIHFYDFLNEQLGEIPGKAVEKIAAACKRNGFSYEILDHVKCGDHAPHTYRVCVDFKVRKN